MKNFILNLQLFADAGSVVNTLTNGYVNAHTGASVSADGNSLSAEVKVKYDTMCARCAEPVSSVLEITFEKDIASSGDVSSDNDDYIIIEDKKLDLLIPVEEEIMLEMPSRTLCKEDCLGLCPKCGKNLNEGPCGCNHKEVDPRLAVLLDLLKDDE